MAMPMACTPRSPLFLAPNFLAAVLPFSDFVTPLQVRAALLGTTNVFDMLILCPCLHKMQQSDQLATCEYPATAAMTTGYVFRTENQAMTRFMLEVGVPGSLVTLQVIAVASRDKQRKEEKRGREHRWKGMIASRCQEEGITWLYTCLPLWTILVATIFIWLKDWYAAAVIAMLLLARAFDVMILKRRAVAGWHGNKEPGVKGDLLILLSQDRWVRMQGFVDDLKAVTSGAWLQTMTKSESIAALLASLLIYGAGALCMAVNPVSSWVMITTFLGQAVLLTLSNRRLREMRMHGRIVEVVGKAHRYEKRLDMAEELIKIHGRNDWAIALGMIVPGDGRVVKTTM